MQVVLAFSVTEPLLQPVPDHPAKVEPEAGVALSVTVVPLLRVVEQVLPQLIPAGLLVIVPPPVPALTTVRVKGVVEAAVVAQASGEYGELPAALKA